MYTGATIAGGASSQPPAASGPAPGRTAWGRALLSWLILVLVVFLVQPAQASTLVSKTVSPTSVSTGANTTLTYTITIFNNDTQSSQPTIADTLPPSVTWLATTSVKINGVNAGTGSTRVGSPQVVTWNNGYTLPVGGTMVIIFTAQITSPTTGVYTNSVTAVDTGGNVPTGSGSCIVTAGNPPSLSIAKSVSPTSVAVSGSATYTVTIGNAGASATSTLKIVDTLPTGFTYTAGTSTWKVGAAAAVAIGNPTTAGQVQTWQVGTTTSLSEIPANTTCVLSFGVTASATNGSYTNGVTAGATNTSTVDSGQTATLVVGTGPTFTVTKKIAGATGAGGFGASYTTTRGATYSYQITITNPAGSGTLTITKIVDTSPNLTSYSNGSAFNDAGWASGTPADPNTIAGSTFTWTGNKTINAGASATLAFNVIAPANASGAFDNDVVVTSTTRGEVDTGPTATLIVNGPLFTIGKAVITPSPANVPAGGTAALIPAYVTYEITVTNSGNVTGNAIVTDAIPGTGGGSQPAYIAGSSTLDGVGIANPGGADPTRTWATFAVTAGQTRRLRFNMSVPAGYAAGQYTDVAQVTDSVFTLNAAVSTGNTAPITVVGAPQVAIDKTVNTSTVSAFQIVDYKIHLRNASTSPATASVTSIDDTLPAGFNFQPGTCRKSTDDITYGALGSFQNPSGTFGTITWSGGAGFPLTLAANSDVYLKFSVQVSGSPGSYTNTATGKGNFSNVVTGPTATVTIGTPPSVTVCKGAATPINTTSACGATATVIAGGGQVCYTITAANASVVAGTAVTFTDTLPSGFSYVAGSSQFDPGTGVFAATGDPSPATGTMTWSGPFALPGAKTVRMRFNANTTATSGSYNNTASASGTNFSTQTSGATATVTVGPAPTVTISNAPTSSVTPAAGSAPFNTTYSFRINETGGATDATGVSFSAILPQYLSVVPGTSQLNGVAISDPSPVTGTAQWSNLGNITKGTFITITFQVAVDATATSGNYYVETQTTGTNYALVDSGPPPSGSGNIPVLTVTGSSAVDLISLSADATRDGVHLQWVTGSEWRNLGYNLLRSEGIGDLPQTVNDVLIIGLGTSHSGGRFAYTDASAQAGRTYRYWLEDVELGGTMTRHGPLLVTVPTLAGTESFSYQPPSVTGPAPAAPPDPPAKATPAKVMEYVTVISQDDRSLVLELKTPDLVVQKRDGTTVVAVPGLPVITQPGLPQLPEAVIPVGAPRDVPFRIEVLSAADLLVLSDMSPPVTPSLTSTGGSGTRRPAGFPTTSEPTVPPRASGGQTTPQGVVPAPRDDANPVTAPTGSLTHDSAAMNLQFAFGVLAADALFPAELATVADQADIRDSRILQVKLYPVQFDPAALTLTQYRTLRVRLTFQGATQLAPATAQGPWAAAFAKLAGEYGLLRQWVATPQRVQDGFRNFAGPTYRLTVSQTGLQRLSAAQLTAAGVDLSHPETLRLFFRDGEVPLDLEVDSGQVAALAFYCPAVVTTYGTEATYFLVNDTVPGRRMATPDMSPRAGEPVATAYQATVHLEQNRFYWANKPADEHPDHWFWDYLSADQPNRSYSFTVTAPAPDAGLSGMLRLALRGVVVDPKVRDNNHVLVAINGGQVADLRWSGTGSLDTTAGFANIVLRPGVNTLTLTMPNDVGARTPLVCVDAFDVTYWRQGWAEAGTVAGTFAADQPTNWQVSGYATPPALYDVSDPAAPGRGRGATFAAGQITFHDSPRGASHRYVLAEAAGTATPRIVPFAFGDDLHGATVGTDYLVITPSALRPAAVRLALHRQTQGLTTRVVDVADIYDEFSGGHPEPEAIQAFLRWAISNWPAPRPTYCVLLGDGHLDYRNDYGTSPPERIPPLLRDNPSIGAIANDNGFAAVLGNDQLPDLFVGRLPANDLTQADAIVDKLVHYDLQAASPWMSRALGVVDEEDPGFETFAAAMAQAHRQLTWAALGTVGTDVIAPLRQGQGLVLYVGHGSMEGWGEQALTIYRAPGGTNDIDLLPAADQAGIYVAANCLNGYFHDPEFACLGEELVRAPHKGAVAFWGTSGYTVPAAQYALTRRFLGYLLDDGFDLGTASTLAKITLFLDDSPYWKDEITAWVLLGDPATRMHR